MMPPPPSSSKRRRVTFEDESSLLGAGRMRYATAIGILAGTTACVLGGHLASVAYLLDSLGA